LEPFSPRESVSTTFFRLAGVHAAPCSNDLLFFSLNIHHPGTPRFTCRDVTENDPTLSEVPRCRPLLFFFKSLRSYRGGLSVTAFQIFSFFSPPPIHPFPVLRTSFPTPFSGPRTELTAYSTLPMSWQFGKSFSSVLLSCWLKMLFFGLETFPPPRRIPFLFFGSSPVFPVWPFFFFFFF